MFRFRRTARTVTTLSAVDMLATTTDALLAATETKLAAAKAAYADHSTGIACIGTRCPCSK